MIEPLFNGNISETFWKTDSDNIKRNYGYQYDNLNRLTNSIYQKENVATNSYNEMIGYDKNGNITSMYRTGYQDGSDQTMPFEIDNLFYGYASNSNKLLSVYDQSAKLDGFRDGNLNGIDFEYDFNGNMVKDRNKKIDLIKYNHLNLPTSITFENGSIITYLYNAVGVKLAKKVTTTSTTESTLIADVDYLTGFQYQKNQLSFFPTSEGYVSVINGNSFNYVFNYTDHLGNNRLSYTQSGSELKILEENHYYPFGLKHSNYNTDIARYKTDQSGTHVVIAPTERSDYQYKYNGKEFQDELGLNMYDYGARNYDAALGRWMNVDPLAEKHPHNNPFMYANNNPILFIDPDGMNYTLYGAAAQGFVAGMQSRMSWNDSSDSGDDDDNDDIIFRDKKGNKLGTYEDGKDEITNITLPIDNFGSSPNLDLNKATLHLGDVDIIGLSISGEITYGIGAGMGQEFIYFLDGKDKNQIFAYSYGSITLGLGGEGLSINALAANFLGKDSLLTSDDYLGTFNYYSGNTPVAGLSYFWGNKNNSVELWPGMGEIWDSANKQTWSGVSVTAPGPNASATVGTAQYMYTPILNNLLKTCGLQE